MSQLLRLAGGFRKFIRTPITHEQAVELLRRRMSERETNFLELAKRLIYDISTSPYRRLLLWAGCEYGDLVHGVEAKGIEGVLKELRGAGVYLNLNEFKSGVPVSRRGLSFETRATDFDNPFLMGERVEAHTSGSRAPRTRVGYDWDFMAEESAHELVLYTMHGVDGAPFTLWLPGPPGLAGIHNLLMNLKQGRVPEKWFSQTPTKRVDMPLEAWLALKFFCWAGRSCGVQVPRCEWASLNEADRIVEWASGRSRSVVRTFASSAVRMAQVAQAQGMDLAGCVIFSGGEPLTETRRRFIESSGAKVFPRYVATETGLVAAGCPHREAVDDMHCYIDRLALIPQEDGAELSHLLFTTLSMHTGKVLFNTAMGDCGRLTTKRCGCVFGELGFDLHLSGVCSDDKLTLEGMTLLTAELARVISAALEQVGAGPDCYQFHEEPREGGLNKLVLAVSPEVQSLDEKKLVGDILDGLRREGGRLALAADFWSQAGTFEVVREQPCISAGQKLLPVDRRRQ